MAKTGQLTAVITPPDATNKNVTWSSSDAAVASVAQNGLTATVTGHKAGTCRITALSEDGGKIGYCDVTVTGGGGGGENVAVTGVSLNYQSRKVVVGDTGQLYATITPGNATNKNVTWSSDNSTIMNVDNTGKWKAVGVGKGAVIVRTVDGGKAASCAFDVSESQSTNPTVPVTGVTMTGCPASDVDTSGSGELTANVLPANASNKNVTWELEGGGTSDGHISITPNGLKCGWGLGVSATVGNQYGIKVTTQDGGFKDYCRINVGSQQQQTKEPKIRSLGREGEQDNGRN